jgi:hypothetical protein
MAVLAAPAPFPLRLQLAMARPWLLHLTLVALTLAAAISYSATTLFIPAAWSPMLDFGAYYRAALDMNAHVDPYLRYNHAIPFSVSMGYVYPPFFAYIIQPLGWLSYAQAKLVALLVLQLSVLASVLLTWKLLGLRTWVARLFILDAFLLSSTLVMNIHLGQLNVVLVPLTLAWVWAYSRGSRLGWVLVGLNVGLKLQQAELFGLTLIRRDLRGLALGLATLATTLAIGGLALGIEYFTQVLPRLSGTVPTIIYNTSLLSDIERLVHPGSDTLLYDPAYTEAHFLLPLLVLPILFFTMRALLGLNDRFLEALVALTAIPLLSNYLTEGHLLPLLPVGILLAAHAWRTHAHRLFWVLVLSVPFFADYVRLYSTVAYLSPYLAQVLFIEYAPGLAAVVVWLCALRLAARAKSIPA